MGVINISSPPLPPKPLALLLTPLPSPPSTLVSLQQQQDWRLRPAVQGPGVQRASWRQPHLCPCLRQHRRLALQHHQHDHRLPRGALPPHLEGYTWQLLQPDDAHHDERLDLPGRRPSNDCSANYLHCAGGVGELPCWPCLRGV